MTRTETLHSRRDVLINQEHIGLVTELFTSHITRLKEHRSEYTTDRLIEHVLDRAENFGPAGHAVVSTAINIAERAHKGQSRKFSGDPYLIHPLRVALLAVDLAEAMGVEVTPQFMASAVLHDVPEDNPEFTKETIAQEFRKFEIEMPGIAQNIAENAEALNHNQYFPTGEKRRLHAEEYYSKIMNLEDVNDPNTLVYRKFIKIADRIDNLIDPFDIPQDSDLAGELIENRNNYINRTGDKGRVIMLLLEDEPFLTTMIEIGEMISRRTLSQKYHAKAA